MLLLTDDNRGRCAELISHWQFIGVQTTDIGKRCLAAVKQMEDSMSFLCINLSVICERQSVFMTKCLRKTRYRLYSFHKSVVNAMVKVTWVWLMLKAVWVTSTETETAFFDLGKSHVINEPFVWECKAMLMTFLLKHFSVAVRLFYQAEVETVAQWRLSVHSTFSRVNCFSMFSRSSEWKCGRFVVFDVSCEH